MNGAIAIVVDPLQMPQGKESGGSPRRLAAAVIGRNCRVVDRGRPLQRSVFDRTGKAAIADLLVAPGPIRGRQPYLEIDVRIMRRVGARHDVADHPAQRDWRRRRAGDHAARRIDLCRRDRRVRQRQPGQALAGVWRRRKAERRRALALQVAVDPLAAQSMRRRRSVPLALKVAADHVEADVAGRCRAVVLNLRVAANLAQSRLARSLIVLALEIAADLDPRPGKTAGPGAILDLHVAAHRHRAFEKGRGALIGLDIAADRRPLLQPVDGQARILRNLYVAANIRLVECAGSAGRHHQVAGNGPGHRPVANSVGGPRRDAASRERGQRDSRKKQQSDAITHGASPFIGPDAAALKMPPRPRGDVDKLHEGRGTCPFGARHHSHDQRQTKFAASLVLPVPV